MGSGTFAGSLAAMEAEQKIITKKGSFVMEGGLVDRLAAGRARGDVLFSREDRKLLRTGMCSWHEYRREEKVLETENDLEAVDADEYERALMCYSEDSLLMKEVDAGLALVGRARTWKRFQEAASICRGRKNLVRNFAASETTDLLKQQRSSSSSRRHVHEPASLSSGEDISRSDIRLNQNEEEEDDDSEQDMAPSDEDEAPLILPQVIQLGAKLVDDFALGVDDMEDDVDEDGVQSQQSEVRATFLTLGALMREALFIKKKEDHDDDEDVNKRGQTQRQTRIADGVACALRACFYASRWLPVAVSDAQMTQIFAHIARANRVSAIEVPAVADDEALVRALEGLTRSSTCTRAAGGGEEQGKGREREREGREGINAERESQQLHSLAPEHEHLIVLGEGSLRRSLLRALEASLAGQAIRVVRLLPAAGTGEGEQQQQHQQRLVFSSRKHARFWIQNWRQHVNLLRQDETKAVTKVKTAKPKAGSLGRKSGTKEITHGGRESDHLLRLLSSGGAGRRGGSCSSLYSASSNSNKNARRSSEVLLREDLVFAMQTEVETWKQQQQELRDRHDGADTGEAEHEQLEHTPAQREGQGNSWWQPAGNQKMETRKRKDRTNTKPLSELEDHEVLRKIKWEIPQAEIEEDDGDFFEM